jgi:hypothetical protein
MELQPTHRACGHRLLALRSPKCGAQTLRKLSASLMCLPEVLIYVFK